MRRKGTELDWSYLEDWVARFSEVEGRGELPAILEDLRMSST